MKPPFVLRHSFRLPHYLAISLLLLPTLSACKTSSHMEGPSEIVKLDEKRNTDEAQRLTGEAFEYMQSNERKDLTKAEKLLNEAIDADIMFGPAHNNLGKVYFKQQKYYSAAWEFQYAAKLMPGRSEPKNNLGLVFEATGKWQDAENNYQLAVNLSPESPEYLGNLIRTRIRAGQKDQKTLDLLSKLIEREERPQWHQWARKQHILINASLNSQHQALDVLQSEIETADDKLNKDAP